MGEVYRNDYSENPGPAGGEPPCGPGVISTRCYELPATEAPAPAPDASMDPLPEPEIVEEAK